MATAQQRYKNFGSVIGTSLFNINCLFDGNLVSILQQQHTIEMMKTITLPFCWRSICCEIDILGNW